MNRDDWGVKRICLSCGVRFYDFDKSPIICPSCNATFDPDAFFKKKAKIAREKNEIDDEKLGVSEDIIVEEGDDEDGLVDLDNTDDDETSMA
jgi:uncharacterized protein (TIGR02300 family)